MQLTNYDPLNTVATLKDVKDSWQRILEAPITTDDGHTFQFDQVSKALIEGAILALGAGVLQWRLEDNSTVEVSRGQLQSYLTELNLKQAERGLQLDLQYLAFKAELPTKRMLKNWEESYGVHR